MRGMDLADRIPSGMVHINDQTVDDEANAPFGGVGASGTGVALRRRRGQHRSLHGDPVGDDAGRDSALSVLAVPVQGGDSLEPPVWGAPPAPPAGRGR